MKKYLHFCRLDYISAQEDAARRMKRGERQVLCPKCNLWEWPDHKHFNGKNKKIA